MPPKTPAGAPFLVSDVVATVANTETCECPRPAGCVQRLGLPPARGRFRDGQGRIWEVVRRQQFADPVNGRVRQTAILLRRYEEDQPVFMTIRCAGPMQTENRYEANRLGRPPRLPFEPVTPPTGGLRR